MLIEEVMARVVATIDVNDTLAEAGKQMLAFSAGALPVLSHGRLVGVLTDRDLAVRATARGLEPRRVRVREVMSHDPITCSARQSVEAAAALMQLHRVRRLVVIDGAGQPAGIIAVDDLALRPESGALALAVLQHLQQHRDAELDSRFGSNLERSH